MANCVHGRRLGDPCAYCQDSTDIRRAFKQLRSQLTAATERAGGAWEAVRRARRPVGAPATPPLATIEAEIDSLAAERDAESSMADAMEQRALVAEQEREDAKADLTVERAANQCDVCGGTGRPVSERPCMCGGTGRMSDAAAYLRRELVTASTEAQERDDLEATLTAQRERAERLEADLAAVREALLGKDATDGCCAPGEWCQYRSWSELALDYAETIRERDAASAAAERARALLEKYGNHREGCAAEFENLRDEPCDCGWDKIPPPAARPAKEA